MTATGSATRVSQLAHLVEQAQAHRPALAIAADRIAGWFVFALLVAATINGIAWRIHDPARAVEVTLALLVISCPCALSLSVPAALATANSALARLGVLPMRTDALDRLACVSDIVFDKTGTLSDGKPHLRATRSFGRMTQDAVVRIALALEQDSGHPLAHAFRQASRSPGHVCFARAVVAHPGRGVEGMVDGARWRLGRADFACDGVDDGALWLGNGHIASARFEISECERRDARETVHALTDAGVAVHLASGDASDAALAFGRRLGIDDVRARQSPEDKLAFVRGLQQHGRRVAMVGDGLNDAPVLAGADVSIAMGDGAALAQRAADLVLTAPSLARIPAAIALARRTRRIVRQNFTWAITYNLLALPLAATGLVTPWVAALGMTLSSLTVTINALRLAHVAPRAEVVAATQAPGVPA